MRTVTLNITFGVIIEVPEDMPLEEAVRKIDDNLISNSTDIKVVYSEINGYQQ